MWEKKSDFKMLFHKKKEKKEPNNSSRNPQYLLNNGTENISLYFAHLLMQRLPYKISIVGNDLLATLCSDTTNAEG